MRGPKRVLLWIAHERVVTGIQNEDMIEQSREGSRWLAPEEMILCATAERRVGRAVTRAVAIELRRGNDGSIVAIRDTRGKLATWARVGLLARGPVGVPRPEPPDRAG